MKIGCVQNFFRPQDRTLKIMIKTKKLGVFYTKTMQKNVGSEKAVSNSGNIRSLKTCIYISHPRTNLFRRNMRKTHVVGNANGYV